MFNVKKNLAKVAVDVEIPAVEVPAVEVPAVEVPAVESPELNTVKSQVESTTEDVKEIADDARKVAEDVKDMVSADSLKEAMEKGARILVEKMVPILEQKLLDIFPPLVQCIFKCTRECFGWTVFQTLTHIYNLGVAAGLPSFKDMYIDLKTLLEENLTISFERVSAMVKKYGYGVTDWLPSELKTVLDAIV